jgi:galactokinase
LLTCPLDPPYSLLVSDHLATTNVQLSSLQPVLPAAIEQDIIIALLPRPSSTPKVRLSNLVSRFKPAEFCLTAPPKGTQEEWHVDFVSPNQGGGWDNYVKAVFAEGLSEFYHGEERGNPVGMDMIVSGVVPPGAGLSVSDRR